MTPEQLRAHIETLCPGARRWFVGYSGGMDSHVLLHMLMAIPDRPEIIAIHVDHGVQAHSVMWARHCAIVTSTFGIRLIRESLKLGSAASEALMRAERYLAFERHCRPGDVLLLAHHADDQAETVLLRLLRGSGARGLAAIPVTRPLGGATICRPLLGLRRDQLFSYATEHALKWMDDPSNNTPRFDRNYLRHQVFPLLESRWPGCVEAFSLSAALSRDASRLLDEFAEQDLKTLVDYNRFSEQRLAISAWEALSRERRVNTLRFWIESETNVRLNADMVDTIIRSIIYSRPDADARLALGRHELRRYRDHLYLLESIPVTQPDACRIEPDKAVKLGEAGHVCLHSAPDGIRCGSEYQIRFRDPGIRCKAAGRVTRTLKDWFQEYSIPPWRRHCVPLLFIDGELAAVADLFVCEGFVAGSQETALRLQWMPDD